MDSSKEHAETVVQAGAIHLIEPRQSLTTRGFLGNNHFIIDPLQHAKDHYADEPHYAMKKEVLQRLPLLTCFARFISDPLGAEPDEDGSELGIVWYQDEFAMPVDEVVIEQIKTLDWEKLAVSYWH